MIDVRWMWLVLDTPAARVERAWAFWAAVTRSRLAPARGARGQSATLVPVRGAPWVKVKPVDEGGGAHVHLDVADPDAAADVAESLGAAEVSRTDGLVVMASPGGISFSLTQWDPEAMGEGQVRGGEPALLDQVCLDVPPRRYAVELGFWSRLTGWEVVAGDRPEFRSLRRPTGMPVRLLVQRLDGGDGPTTGHPDLACADREVEVAAHVRLGARVVAPGWGWTVMRDPVGQVYCLTDRSPSSGV